MRKVTSINKLALFCLLFLAVSFGVKAQHGNPIPMNYIFSSDSLVGFDENSAKQGAFDVGAYGEEFKVYMYVAKRQFIDGKYKLIKPVKEVQYITNSTSNNNTNYGVNAKGNPGNPNILVAACNNEDFELASVTFPVPSSQPVTTSLAVTGWTINGGSNSSWGATGNCSNTASGITGNPNPVTLISGGAPGYLDPIIGASYRIWSVFGPTTTAYPLASAAQTPTFNCYGDWFIQLNNSTPGSSVNKMTKCFPVTTANALFQFAFISVLQTGHCCCDNGSFRLRVLTGGSCGGVMTPTTCPSFTAASNSGAGCTSQPGGNNAVCTSTGNTTTYLAAASAGWAYNKWKVVTLDLTSFLGQAVQIEVVAMDCPYSGHAGYVYFDAQCQAMDVCTNLGCYPAGTPSITVPTCGAGSTATITAPAVTGGYTWTIPGSASYTVAPGSNGQTIYTGTTGDHTLTMNPPGSCSPIVRIIKVVIAPAPNLALPTNTMYTCSNPTLNGVSLLMASGTASNNLSIPNYTVVIAPSAPTGTVGVSANTATYTGLAVGVNTITIVDSVGCIATQTLNVTAAPLVPMLSIGSPSGTVIGCNPPTIPLVAVNSSTDPILASSTFTYNWAGPSTASLNTGTFNVSAPGTYTLTGSAQYTTVATGTTILTSCIATTVITVTGSTLMPVTNVSPSTRSLTCNGGCQTFTATTPSGTANIVGTWYSSSGPIVGPTGTPMLLCANAPGTYTAEFCSTISGCCATQTVAVFSNTQIPTVTVTPTTFNGFTINCTNPKVGMDVNTNATIGPFGYTWTPLPAPPGTPSVTPTGGYTVTVPGQYEIKFHDGNNCDVTQTITVYIDTLRPSPLAITNLPSNSFTLNCYNSCLTASAITAPLLSASQYSWTQTGPLTLPSNTIQICLANITSSTAPTVYTVSAMGANGCVGKAKVNFYKDIYMPTYTPVFTPSIGITCGNPCVAMTPQSSTTTPINFTFTSPPPTQTATTAGALMCVPGTYTMTYQNIANGCIRTGTTNVPQNVIPPAVVPQAPIYLPCGQTTTIVSAGTTTSSSTYSYTWDGPVGSAMSCLGGTACATSSVNMPGVYEVFIYNSLNGCSTTNSVLVVAGQIAASFNPDPYNGYSPLSVNFDNTSQTGSTIGGTITTQWSFGNGITYTTSGTSTSYSATGLPDAATIYQSAGSYTVLLVVTQIAGTSTCVGTATQVVTVELPSKLDVPNVFTPNGDGVNDVFMLQTTNVTEITLTIFDRWGVKMYDVKAEKGNVSWDGKNFGKKDVPAGTYFYILTAKGKDGKEAWTNDKGEEVKQKGTISLYR